MSKDLGSELRNAEARYYIGFFISMFLTGVLSGSFVGWLIWG
jgi:hypothetical protein